MKPAAFFRTPEVRALLERAARAAGTPLSVHYVDRGEEGLRVTGIGGCAACKFVSDLPDGIARCRASRTEAAVPALRRDRPVPFLCHMGFACVSMPALPGTGLGFTLTFGPYCPAEAPQGLEQDALWGFSDLGLNPEDGLPVSLADIRLNSVDAVAAVAEWTSDSLGALWKALAAPAEAPASEEDDESDEAPPDRPVRRGRAGAPAKGPYDAPHIAAALAGGDTALARRFVLAALAEAEAGARVKVDVRRARAAAVVMAVLEAAHRAQLNTSACWDGIPEFLERLKEARTNEQIATAALSLLTVIKRRNRHAALDSDGFARLNGLVMARLTDGITLNEVARELGQHPTAITHRLKRRLGLSFSQYVGQLRVNMAKDLLRTTRLSIGEVSRRVGIRDGSNLGKLFRKFEGISPQEYRRRFGRKTD